MIEHWTDEDEANGTDVDRWLELYAKDDNTFWISSAGHHANIIDELIYRLEQADKRAEDRIIALLEKHEAGECGFGVTHDLVELIKGENK